MKLFLLSVALLAPALHAQDWAKQRLEKSPRHREWVKVQHDGRSVDAYIAYPEVSRKAPVVLVIHEIFGLSDWAQLAADEFRRGRVHRHRARPALGEGPQRRRNSIVG